MEKYEIRMGGLGGQGIITACTVLAETAVSQGYNAIQSQSYGPEARGGSCKAEVVISDSEIFYPKASAVDMLFVLTQQSYDKYASTVKPGGILMMDSKINKSSYDSSGSKVYELPIIDVAENEMKLPITANVILLGVLAKIMGTINRDILLNKVLEKLPQSKKDINIKAFSKGYDMVH